MLACTTDESAMRQRTPPFGNGLGCIATQRNVFESFGRNNQLLERNKSGMFLLAIYHTDCHKFVAPENKDAK